MTAGWWVKLGTRRTVLAYFWPDFWTSWVNFFVSSGIFSHAAYKKELELIIWWISEILMGQLRLSRSWSSHMSRFPNSQCLFFSLHLKMLSKPFASSHVPAPLRFRGFHMGKHKLSCRVSIVASKETCLFSFQMRADRPFVQCEVVALWSDRTLWAH